jgi:hypothetical protein
MIFKTVLTTLFLTLCLSAQANESPKQASIFALQPFERLPSSLLTSQLAKV